MRRTGGDFHVRDGERVAAAVAVAAVVSARVSVEGMSEEGVTAKRVTRKAGVIVFVVLGVLEEGAQDGV